MNIEFSKNRGEPEWLTTYRIRSYEKYKSLPMPLSRRMDYSKIILSENDYTQSSGDELKNYTELFSNRIINSILQMYRNNLYIQLNGNILEHNAAPAADEQGVLFTSIQNVTRTDIFKKYFDIFSSYEVKTKMFHLNKSLWQNGLFLYVPKNVRVELPMINIQVFGNTMNLPTTYIIAEEGSSVTLIDSFLSTDDKEMVSSGTVQLYVGQNAKIDYFSLQEASEGTSCFNTKRAIVSGDGNLNWVEVSLGGNISQNNIETTLAGSGAEANISGLFLGKSKQQIEYNTIQDHLVPHTKSDLLYIGALTESAHSNYEGIIKVHKGAQKTDAYQSNRNLLLSKAARADSEPYLEIEANDVRCTHGATVGPIDQEDLFYLMSRGLSKNLATNLLVQGFFSRVIEKITVEELRTGIQQYIEENSSIQ